MFHHHFVCDEHDVDHFMLDHVNFLLDINQNPGLWAPSMVPFSCGLGPEDEAILYPTRDFELLLECTAVCKCVLYIILHSAPKQPLS
jgi:hypothetical protein